MLGVVWAYVHVCKPVIVTIQGKLLSSQVTASISAEMGGNPRQFHEHFALGCLLSAGEAFVEINTDEATGKTCET